MSHSAEKNTPVLRKVGLLSPAIAVMNRLKYPQKFLLISLLFAAPLALVMYLLSSEINDRVDFAQKELLGDEYLRPLRRLLEHVPQARRLASEYSRGFISARPALIRKHTEIEEDVSMLESVEKRLGATLDSEGRFKALKENWRFLNEQTMAMKTDGIDNLHLQLISDIRELMSHVGDTSNLILDPDLDSYYLMDAVLLKLPESQDLLAELRMSCDAAIRDREITAEERAEITRQQGRMKANLEAVKAGMEVAFRNNPAQNLKRLLEKPVQEYFSSGLELLRTIDREIIGSDEIKTSNSAYEATTGQALLASFSLWDRTVEALDGLLTVRAERFISKNHFVKLFSLLALAVISYLWMAFYSSVMRTVSSLEAASQRMVGGDLSQPVVLETKDELGQVASSFNHIATRLRSEWAQAQEESARAHAAEGRLRSSEERWRLILETAMDAVFTLDDHGQVTGWNSQAEKMFGWPRQDILGRTLVETIVPERFRTSDTYGLNPFLAHGQRPIVNERVEVPVIHRDGHELSVELSISSFQSDGSYTMSGFVRDITARKRTEQEIGVFMKQLERSNQELQDFAHVASHDLQEPLRKIRAFGDRLKAKYSEALHDDGRDYLNRMQNAAERMQGLISDLLTYSRVTTQGKPFVPVDLATVAREVLSDLEVRVEQTHGRVEVGDLPQVEADPTQMRQLLQNLIGNSLKYHKKDVPPVIKIRGQYTNEKDASVPSANGLCTLVFEDNGIGFDQKYNERIFGMFQRLHGRGEYEGTGVGLALCRKITERHGGRIVASSTPGQGATFTVVLPAKQLKGGVACELAQ